MVITQKRNTFSILFYMDRTKTNKKGEHPIYCRVTINGKLKLFSTQITLLENKWNSDKAKAIGSNEFIKTTNNHIESIKINLNNIRAQLTEQNKLITAEIIVNIHLGKVEKKHTILEIHKFHNEEHIKKLIGKDYAQGTYERYKTSYEHVSKFLRSRYKVDDMLLNDLSFSFAADYLHYLKVDRECNNNTSVKYIKNLKAVINYAVTQGWLLFNPIDKFKLKMEKVEKDYLTIEELNSIAKKDLPNERLSAVRDVFIFCCYTGLGYSDILKLSLKNIVIGINGKKQINISRTKTDVIARIPLLDPALLIIEKYKDHPACLYNNTLFPVKSNQKQNAYLKEIGTICNCKKDLTTHTARHTFATTMLTWGGSIEAVSSMLGHTNIKTTQIYAKIVSEKVNREMENINLMANDNFNLLINS